MLWGAKEQAVALRQNNALAQEQIPLSAVYLTQVPQKACTVVLVNILRAHALP